MGNLPELKGEEAAAGDEHGKQEQPGVAADIQQQAPAEDAQFEHHHHEDLEIAHLSAGVTKCEGFQEQGALGDPEEAVVGAVEQAEEQQEAVFPFEEDGAQQQYLHQEGEGDELVKGKPRANAVPQHQREHEPCSGNGDEEADLTGIVALPPQVDRDEEGEEAGEKGVQAEKAVKGAARLRRDRHCRSAGRPGAGNARPDSPFRQTAETGAWPRRGVSSLPERCSAAGSRELRFLPP